MWVALAAPGSAGLPRSVALPKGYTLPSVPTIQYPEVGVPDAAAGLGPAAWTGAEGATKATRAATRAARPATAPRGAPLHRGRGWAGMSESSVPSGGGRQGGRQ